MGVHRIALHFRLFVYHSLHLVDRILLGYCSSFSDQGGCFHIDEMEVQTACDRGLRSFIDSRDCFEQYEGLTHASETFLTSEGLFLCNYLHHRLYLFLIRRVENSSRCQTIRCEKVRYDQNVHNSRNFGVSHLFFVCGLFCYELLLC